MLVIIIYEGSSAEAVRRQGNEKAKTWAFIREWIQSASFSGAECLSSVPFTYQQIITRYWALPSVDTAGRRVDLALCTWGLIGCERKAEVKDGDMALVSELGVLDSGARG